MKSVMLGKYEAIDFKAPFIIAELGSNHNGDMDIAKKLIVKAKEAGCHCVKFQSWTKDTIFSKKVYEDNYFLADDYRNRTDFTLEKIVDKFSISEKELKDMKNVCDEVGIEFASTPFSPKEVDYLTDVLKVNFIKVASMDLNNYPFLDYIARKNVPIILSTGLSDISEIDEAVRTIENAGNRNIVLMHCVSIYPPDDKEINLNNIDMLRDLYNYPVGFSDHSIGTTIPLAAVAKGVCVIEKHFTLDKDMFGWDHKVSATFDEMKTIVSESVRINNALGNYRKSVSQKEMVKRDAFRRSIVAAKEIPMGKLIELDDLDLKRPGTGLEPKFINLVTGKRAKKHIQYDTIITWEDIE